jgi:hypothetical protein
VARKELVAHSCINHPERPSNIRCRRCNVPICQKCAVKSPHGAYCSDACATEMEAFMQKAADLDTPLKPPKSYRFVRLLIKLMAFGGAIAFGMFLYRKGTFNGLQHWIMSILRTARGG